MKSNYCGIIEDLKQGMTPTGNIIRDAWVFGILDECETCQGWTIEGIDSLYDKVSQAWEPYGHLVSNLPPDLREKHRRIYNAAIQAARQYGWDPNAGLVDEH